MGILDKAGYLAAAAVISCTPDVTYVTNVVSECPDGSMDSAEVSEDSGDSEDGVGDLVVEETLVSGDVSQDISAQIDVLLNGDVGADLDTVEVPSGLSAYLSEQQFNAFFVNRDDPACTGSYFNYQSFLSAAQKYPEFLSEGTKEQRLQELAAFLANIGHETTGGWPTAPGGQYAWGLCFKEEVGCDTAPPGYCMYCVEDSNWPCAPGARYYGRGPIQISYNFNYGPAGKAIGVDLLNHPEIVAQDAEVAFRTALWFWMTPQSPKPSCHEVMAGKWIPSAADIAAGRLPGFGETVNIINGGVECGKGLQNPPQENPANLVDRLGYYAYFAEKLAVSPGQNVDCNKMKSY